MPPRHDSFSCLFHTLPPSSLLRDESTAYFPGLDPAPVPVVIPVVVPGVTVVVTAGGGFGVPLPPVVIATPAFKT